MGNFHTSDCCQLPGHQPHDRGGPAVASLSFHLPLRGWLAAAALAAVLVLCGPVRETTAQESPTARPVAEATEPPRIKPVSGDADASSRLRQATGATIYLEGPDGRPVPVPADANLEDFLNWLNTRQQETRPQQPDFSLTSVALSGTADERLVRLSIEIGIRLYRQDSWVRVPLFLNEAVFRGSSYEGPGEVSYDGFSRDTDHSCWLKGTGLHRLKFQIVLPVRSQLNTRRIQLRLPEAAVSTLELDLPWNEDRLSLKAPAGTALRSTPTTELSTRVELAGMGKLLDLQWEPLPEQSRTAPVLQTRTRIRISLSENTAFLRAEQEIQALQGGFQEAIIDLPAGFELLDLEGASYRTHSLVGTPPTRVRVEFNSSTAGPVKLRWLFSSRLADRSARLRISGFSVQGARRQTGEIAVERADGLQMTRVERDGRFVTRINVSEFVGSGQISSAYSFLKQPFQLVLDVTPVEPVFEVSPELFLLAVPERLTLWGVFRVQIAGGSTERGSLEELTIKWPGWAEAGWTLEPLELSQLVSSVVQDEPNTIRLRLTKQTKNSFELVIRAERALTDDDLPATLTLPAMQSPLESRTVLHLLQADSCTASLTAARPDVLRERDSDAISPERWPTDTGERVRRLRRTDFELPTPVSTPELQLNITRHPGEIEIRRQLRVEERRDQVILREQFDYRVQWERVAAVQLQVPASARPGTVMFQLLRENEPGRPPLTIQPESVEPSGTGEDAAWRTVLLRMPEPLLGRFSIAVQRVIHGPEEPVAPGVLRSAKLTRVEGLPSVETILTVLPGPATEIVPDSTRWVPRVASQNAWREWAARSDPRELRFQLVPRATGQLAQFVVPRLLLETEIDAAGRVWTSATWAVRGPARHVKIALPDSLKVDSIIWEQQYLNWTPRRQNDGRLILDVLLPETSSDEAGTVDHFLSLRCYAARTSPLGWSRQHRLEAPSLVGNIWVENTLWWLAFPGFDQYLLTDPPGLTSAMRWQRSGLWWSRNPLPGYQDAQRWIAGLPAANSDASGLQRNIYAFTSLGNPRTVTFQSIYRPLLVLLGAGVAWAAGLILLKFPITRSMLTLLTVSAMLAVAALWYWSAIILLLQPAILGLLLAVAMACIQEMFRRQRTSTILTIPSPSELIGPTGSRSSFERSLHAALGSGEMTEIGHQHLGGNRDSVTGSWHGLQDISAQKPVASSSSVQRDGHS